MMTGGEVFRESMGGNPRGGQVVFPWLGLTRLCLRDAALHRWRVVADGAALMDRDRGKADPLAASLDALPHCLQSKRCLLRLCFSLGLLQHLHSGVATI